MSDMDDAMAFESLYKDKVYNLVGKTTLIEFLQVMAGSDLMISNETSAPHFAVALDKADVIVLSNGNHYGRFTPYPKDISERYRAVYPPAIEENSENYLELVRSYGYGSRLNIADIKSDRVINEVDKIFHVRKIPS
jgi:ADP-heptose:LPS heptosyltransferase